MLSCLWLQSHRAPFLAPPESVLPLMCIATAVELQSGARRNRLTVEEKLRP